MENIFPNEPMEDDKEQLIPTMNVPKPPTEGSLCKKEDHQPASTTITFKGGGVILIIVWTML